MKSNWVTQQDIAREAETSASLVSRILNDKLEYISVSEETMRRVKRAAEDLGYRGARRPEGSDRAGRKNGETHYE